MTNPKEFYSIAQALCELSDNPYRNLQAARERIYDAIFNENAITVSIDGKKIGDAVSREITKITKTIGGTRK